MKGLTGAVPWRQRNTNVASLKVIRSGTDSQWSSRSKGVTWSNFRAPSPKTSRAAAWRTCWRRFSWRAGSPTSVALPPSRRVRTSAATSDDMTRFGSDLQTLRICLTIWHCLENVRGHCETRVQMNSQVTNSGRCVIMLCVLLYTVSQKMRHPIVTTTSSKLNQFSKLFHC